MAGTFAQNYTDGTGFTFDNTKTLISSGLSQIDQRPTNSILGATYTDSFDLSFAADGFVDLSAIVNGTPSLVGGKLVCSGSQGVCYQDTLIGDLAGNWAAKFRYYPDYTGSPTTNANIITISQASGGIDDIVIFHSSSGGSLRITANGLSADVFDVWAGVAAQEYVFQVFCINNVVSLFIGETQIGVDKTIIPSQGTDSTYIHLGAYALTYNNAEGSFSDLILYSTATQTDTYIVPEADYLSDIITYPLFTYSGSGNIETFLSATITGEGLNYTLNGLYYNNGWVLSDGVTEFSDSTTIVSNIVTFPVSDTMQIIGFTANSETRATGTLFELDYRTAITSLANYKTFYGITSTDQDVQISAFIPVVEEEYLNYRNAPFDEDPADTIVYPSGSGTVANMMINYQISLIADNGRSVASEKLGSYSVSYGGSGNSYPSSITSKIKRYTRCY